MLRKPHLHTHLIYKTLPAELGPNFVLCTAYEIRLWRHAPKYMLYYYYYHVIISGDNVTTCVILQSHRSLSLDSLPTLLTDQSLINVLMPETYISSTTHCLAPYARPVPRRQTADASWHRTPILGAWQRTAQADVNSVNDKPR